MSNPISGVSDVLSERELDCAFALINTGVDERTVERVADQWVEAENLIRGHIAALASHCAELEAALREVEWDSQDARLSRRCRDCHVSFGCPFCGRSEEEGHKAHCTLAEVLARATLTPTVETEPLCSHCQFCSCGCHAPAVVETEDPCSWIGFDTWQEAAEWWKANAIYWHGRVGCCADLETEEPQ